MTSIMNFITFAIAYLKYFFTRGKGTYIEMTTNLFEDVHVNIGDVGVICRKQFVNNQTLITIDFVYRFLVCAREHYKIINKNEYLEKLRNIEITQDLTHLVELGQTQNEDPLKDFKKKSRHTFH